MRRLLSLIVLVSIAACSSQALQPTAPPPPTPVALAPTATATIAPTPSIAPTFPPLPTSTPLLLKREAASGRPAFVRGGLTRRPIVVMIDNHPDAYPQTGLDQAAVVFEALAEYGVTRFMAVYTPELAPLETKIGPVRSARIYFVQWAMGMRAVYVHAGGSPEGLQRLSEDANTLVINFDGIEEGVELVYNQRDLSRQKPHNLYVTQEDIVRFVADRGPKNTKVDLGEVGFLFAREEKQKDAIVRVNNIGYYFLNPNDPISWEYDPSDNRYFRLRRNRAHIDAGSDEQIWFKSVVVMEIKEEPIPGDEKGRIEQDVIGEGPAHVFSNGGMVEGVWRKESEEAPLRFYDILGNEIYFPAGPLWIAAIPDIKQLSFNE